MEYNIEQFNNIRGSYEVNGGKVLVFGDLHLSSTFEGKHKAYLEECYLNMQRIIDLVKKHKPSAVIFLGDLCGVNERNIKDRQFLTRVLMFFGSLYHMTKGNVYSVKGNHEMGDFSDFDMLTSLGYIKNPKYVDYIGDGNVELRFHFVNYGDENKQLDIHPDASNVVLGHNDYYIDGVTNWYSAKAGVELKKLSNFNGVELVFSGHIHIPSEEMLYTTLPNGESVGLFYTGSPSRVAERINDCWYIIFEYDTEEKSTGYDAQLFGLEPASSVFYDEEDYNLEDEEELSEEKRHSEALDIVVNEVLNSRMVSGDLFRQIDIIPATDEEKNIAKDYLRRAMEV